MMSSAATNNANNNNGNNKAEMHIQALSQKNHRLAKELVRFVFIVVGVNSCCLLWCDRIVYFGTAYLFIVGLNYNVTSAY